MKLDQIVAWYQKKIGTYDKQQWEKTVEQKILDGFSGVTLKTAKLKTEFIDVDLVRGSTFPKAKPKQSLVTVIRLAILRYLFLPLYAQWWVKQTSPNIFALLLFLYITQMFNWAIYTLNIQRPAELTRNDAEGIFDHSALYESSHLNITTPKYKQSEEHVISMAVLLIPMGLSFLLSLIHSQIVATNIASGAKVKRRRCSNTSLNGKAPREPRVRRRKKLVRMRTQEYCDASTQLRKSNGIRKLHTLGVENLTKRSSNISLESTVEPSSSATSVNFNAYSPEAYYTSAGVVHQPSYMSETAAAAALLTLDLKNTTSLTQASTHPTANCSTSCCTDIHGILVNKKRNVNWHSPIRNYANETREKQQQTSPQALSSSATTSDTNSPRSAGADKVGCSSCSNSSAGNSPSKTVRIDECVQEFYDDLVQRTVMLSPLTDVSQNDYPNGDEAQCAGLNMRRPIGEDDGFESLNGKSSSGDEEANFPLATTSAMGAKNQLRSRLNAGNFGAKIADCLETPLESIYEKPRPASACDGYTPQQSRPPSFVTDESSDDTEEGDEGGTVSSPNSTGNNSNYNECTTSATEWLGVTTNSEECSYSSEWDNCDDYKAYPLSDEDGNDLDFTPATILNPHGTSDRISCTIWDQHEIKKAQMSVLEISSCIIDRVESMPETNDYIYIGACFSLLLSFIPCFCRLCEATLESDKDSELSYFDVPMLLWEKTSCSFTTIFGLAFGFTHWERAVLFIAFIQRFCLTSLLFIIFAVAERTFKQRFLYAKLFSHLTSSRRARKSNLPHFRLNKVRNIKTWLSVRSYLKKRGPQRSVEIIVSAAFIVTLLLLSFLSVEWLKDSVQLHSHLNLEALVWSSTIGIFLLRFMTLGNKIHHKYRSISVLITEQINLYLQIEQKPKKKDELMVSNSVLKLAADLLKELESPFKISGLSANPYLFTTIKVVILSALSGVLSEMLGFKLKLHKIKIK